MGDYESINHTKYECKYHVVFIPKYRKKKLYGQIRQELGRELRRLAEQKESRVLEGHMMTDHVHMLMEIPPKHSVSQVVGYIKGKSAIWIARAYGERQRYFSGQHMWARGYFVSTVGLDEEVIREYIKNQENDDRRQDELFD
ncbi:MAG: IS200/IS605 family transposase [Treponemataceae bacterium]|nr:IS200/IS605 family transposase [Treponemataceae bacterium]